MIKELFGLLLIIFGFFIFASGFQSINCELDGICFGMELWLSLFCTDNMYLYITLIVICLACLFVGMSLFID